MSFTKRRRQLLEKKQQIINRLWHGLQTGRPTKVGRTVAARMRRILKIESDLATLERQQSQSP